MWHYGFISFFKIKSPSTVTRTSRISKPELYHTPRQLSQYDCPIKIFFPTRISICIWNKLYASLYLKDVINMSLQKFNLSVFVVHFKLHKSMSKYFHICTKKIRGTVKPAFWSEALVVEASDILFSVHHCCRFRTFTCSNWGIDSPTLCSKCVLPIKTR